MSGGAEVGGAVAEGVEDSEGEQMASPASMAKGKSESYGGCQHEWKDGIEEDVRNKCSRDS
jgi:hypothetical protein